MIRSLTVILFLFVGCIKDNEPTPEILPFTWVKKDNKLNYTYYSPYETTINALTLTVITNPGNENLRFDFSYPKWNIVTFDKYVGSGYNVYVKKDGLFTSSSYGCGVISLSSFYFIRAPLIPKINDYYPDYYCKDRIYKAHKVIEVNKSINVPLGSFKTFVMYDTLDLRKEYWDEKNGLIKFEIFDTSGALLGRFELTSKNY